MTGSTGAGAADAAHRNPREPPNDASTPGDPLPGAFITMEGGEGGGKSTQVRALVTRLRARGIPALATREPGGSEAAERIRTALLAGRFERHGIRAEALLFAAARIDHLDRTILPALARGSWVVCDRFHDSTRAYQGVHGGVDAGFLASLERVSLAGVRPALTLILDVPAAIGLARADRRRQGDADRYERQAIGFHQRLRELFLAIAAAEPRRCVVVDATQPPAEVEQAIWDAVRHRLPMPAAAPGTAIP